GGAGRGRGGGRRDRGHAAPAPTSRPAVPPGARAPAPARRPAGRAVQPDRGDERPPAPLRPPPPDPGRITPARVRTATGLRPGPGRRASLAGAGPGRRADAVRSGIPSSPYPGIMTTPATDRRVWLITGATSGFGRSLTEQVLRLGDIVVGAGRSISRLDDLKGAYPDRPFPVVLDVTDTARDAEVVDETAERLGRLDVLVNGAGRTQVGALEETTDAEMCFLFELHYFGPAALTKAALPHMRRQ